MPVIDRAQVAAALPRYTLGPQLGAGSFGLVFAARHDDLDRPVAVKVVVASPSAAESARFRTEAQILGRLDHPHIVQVHDYLRAGDLAILIVELLGGGALTRYSLSPVDACATGIAMADALAHAHSHGVLHRDIKPDNILFTAAGQAKLTDFGLGRLVTDPSTTFTGQLVGTPRYLAPEVIAGGAASARADLYALAVVLHELLAERPLFDPGLSRPELLRHQLQVAPPPLDGVPSSVASCVLAGLAKDPARRPPDLDAFRSALLDATVAAYGADWPARCGLLLRLRRSPAERDTDIGPFAGATPRLPPISPSPPDAATRSTRREPNDADATQRLPPTAAEMPGPPAHAHGASRPRPGRPRRGRRLLAVLAGAVAVVAAVTGGLVAGLGRATHPPAASPGQATSTARIISLNSFDSWGVGPAGQLYILNLRDSVVASVGKNGQETLFAGTAAAGFSGDGGPASAAALDNPGNIGVDGSGNVYILDMGNGRVRRVDTHGRITTIAGGGTIQDTALTASLTHATAARFADLGDPTHPGKLAVDTNGDVYFAGGSRVYKADTTGTLAVLARIGPAGGPGLLPQLTTGTLGALSVHDGRLYGTDIDHNVIRMLAPDGTVTTVAGTGTVGFTGDGGPATSAALNLAHQGSTSGIQSALAVDAAGDLFLADPDDHRIRRIGANGIITTVAGTGQAGVTTSDTRATQTSFEDPRMVAAEPGGTLIVADLAEIMSIDLQNNLHVISSS